MKRVFPVMWFGFLAFFLVAGIASGAAHKDRLFLFLPPMMAIFGVVLMKKLFADLVDEVTDCGDYLMIRYKGQQENIYLSNIINVSATVNQSASRITLRLRAPCKFGQDISFYPVSKMTMSPFQKNEIFEDLIVRCDRARRGV